MLSDANTVIKGRSPLFLLMVLRLWYEFQLSKGHLRIVILEKSLEGSFELAPVLSRKHGQLPDCKGAGRV